MGADKKSKMLSVKDLVNVGIFTAIYFIIFFISTFTSYIPIFVFIFTTITAILAGIPIVLFLTRVKKFGMCTIMCLILGIICFVMGNGVFSIVVATVCGLLCDLILMKGQYKSWKSILWGYVVMSLWPVGTLIRIVVMGNAYFEGFRASLGDAYADQTIAIYEKISWGLVPGIIVITAVAAIIGAYLGKVVLKKHFVRAGIA